MDLTELCTLITWPHFTLLSLYLTSLLLYKVNKVLYMLVTLSDTLPSLRLFPCAAHHTLPYSIRTLSCDLRSGLVSGTVSLFGVNTKLFRTFPDSEPEVRLLCNTDTCSCQRYFPNLPQKTFWFFFTWWQFIAKWLRQQIIALICLYCDTWNHNLWL